jgi:uncharacterized protein (TIGR01244 family)
MLLAVVAGCGTKTVDEAQFGIAQRLEGYDDLRNLFRDGSIFFAGQPGEAAYRQLAEEEGITAVICIRMPSELQNLGFDEVALAAELGMAYENLGFSYDSYSADLVDRFAKTLTRIEGPVLIHCGSSNRVGGLWANYLNRHRGIEIDEAIRIGKTAGLRSQAMIDAVRRVAGEK